mgnify:CR=1 FL=1
METKTIENKIFFKEVAERVTEGARVRIRARGNSMLPFIRDGKDDIILEKPNTRSFQKGRLLLAKLQDDRYVLHRVKKIKGNNILLRGDGNLNIYENCTSGNIIAEATEIIRNGKSITTNTLRWKLYSFLWPGNLFLRRVALALYRRQFLSVCL